MQCGIFLGDSVLGCGARIGSGVITANRKFNQTEVYVKDNAGGVPKNLAESFSVPSLVDIAVSERTSLPIPVPSSRAYMGGSRLHFAWHLRAGRVCFSEAGARYPTEKEAESSLRQR